MKLFIVGALTVFSLLVALTLAENYGFGGGFGGGAGGYGGGYGSGYTFIPLPGYGGSLGGLGGLDDSWICKWTEFSYKNTCNTFTFKTNSRLILTYLYTKDTHSEKNV